MAKFLFLSSVVAAAFVAFTYIEPWLDRRLERVSAAAGRLRAFTRKRERT